MKRHAWRSGDIIQIALPAGYRYVQLVGKYAHLAGKGPRRFDLLRVLNVVTKEPETDLTTLGESSSAYWFLSFAGLLVEDTRFVFIGNAACSAESPTMRRRFLGGWIIVGTGPDRFVPNPIGDEVARLPLEEIVPSQVVFDRLAANWAPEDDREDVAQEIRRYKERARVEDIEESRETIFFIEFPSSREAAGALGALRNRGYTVAHEHRKKSLAVTRPWSRADSLDSMDLLELDLLAVTREFKGTISGRETSA